MGAIGKPAMLCYCGFMKGGSPTNWAYDFVLVVFKQGLIIFPKQAPPHEYTLFSAFISLFRDNCRISIVSGKSSCALLVYGQSCDTSESSLFKQDRLLLFVYM